MDLIKIANDIIADYGPKVIGAILTLIIGFWVIGRIVNMGRKLMDKREVDPSLKPFFLSLLSISLKVMLLLSVAGMFGIQTTSFIAIFSAMAFAIGMALQGNLGHFASGVMLLLFKPFKVGDLVDVQGNVGVVEAITLFNTTLLTPDNKKIFLPNGFVTGGPITNISGQGEIAVFLTFGIGYDDDIDKARSIIQKVVDSCPHILLEKGTGIFVSELADSSVNFAVRPWCKSEHYWDVYFCMHESIKKEFDIAGIGIPYPQMDVHLSK